MKKTSEAVGAASRPRDGSTSAVLRELPRRESSIVIATIRKELRSYIPQGYTGISSLGNV